MSRVVTGTSLIALTVAALAAASSAGAAPPAKSRVIVGFQPGAAAAASARTAIARAGGRAVVDLSEVDAVAIELPSAAVAALQRAPGVAYVEDDVERHTMALTTPSTGTPYLVGQAVPYGIPMVQADVVSDANGAQRTLCIVDSGIDGAHEDLQGLNVTGQNLSGSGAWNTDEDAHGTHVAGTIAAVNNALGVVGVMPNRKIRLVIQKVFDASGSAPNSVILQAALNCRTAGANVISMSLGGSASSRTEQRTYDSLASSNILVIAAAGNAGDRTTSYPAGYASVMSVAAVDQNLARASFSQQNKDVEISGPGVDVYSTVPLGAVYDAALTVGGAGVPALEMDGTPHTSASAPLANFGDGTTATAGSMAGKVCLIARGTNSFADKVLNCQNSGGAGAVIYNNVAGSLSGTLNGTATTIPSVGISQQDGQALLNKLGQTASISFSPAKYAYFSGTSMATPHVSAVAALVWSQNLQCTAAQLRNSLNKSAKDLGAAGRDVAFGFGLVQAKAAVDRIAALGCGN